MGSHPPSVPPAGRSDKGPGETGNTGQERKNPPREPKTGAARGQQQSVAQNTRNPGFQQDR